MYTHVANPDQSFDAKCPDNTILLRCDLHKIWDDNRFAILPKAGGWYTHVLLNSNTTELEEEYHNLELQPLRGVSRYFFFCRFALAIIAKSAFFRQCERRKLVILDKSGSSRVRDMSVDEYKKLINLAASGTSRGNSPTKRQRRDQPDENAQEHEHSQVDDTYEDDLEEEAPRGRPRKRAGSPMVPLRHCLTEELASSSPPPKRQRLTDDSVQPHTPPQSMSPTRL
ncbi:HNH endonuclease domain-containing [Fusarium albosuccineum]|uniref:HNH endonuclease domain-containing n=1 Tax=Fusarium albosuccineum TaxID=1237068 RepID=A0A8H4P7Q1_9HYPO|nr:HNH endonuclease domain-containing [Fusarium albosuccineum]